MHHSIVLLKEEKISIVSYLTQLNKELFSEKGIKEEKGIMIPIISSKMVTTNNSLLTQTPAQYNTSSSQYIIVSLLFFPLLPLISKSSTSILFVLRLFLTTMLFTMKALMIGLQRLLVGYLALSSPSSPLLEQLHPKRKLKRKVKQCL